MTAQLQVDITKANLLDALWYSWLSRAGFTRKGVFTPLLFNPQSTIMKSYRYIVIAKLLIKSTIRYLGNLI